MTGEIIETHRGIGEFSFEWRISNFWALDMGQEYTYTSPLFSFCNERWSLSMNLSSYMWDSVSKSLIPEGVEITLDRYKFWPRRVVHFGRAIKVPDGTAKKVEERQFYSADGPEYSFTHICLTSDLRSEKSRLVPDDVLTLTCALKSDAVRTPLATGHDDLIRGLKAILVGGRHSDFTLKVEDREWRVHKVILESKSEYFASMFRRGWAESESGEARFHGISKDVMDHVLNFIYAGDVEDVTSENVCDLYVAAHRFMLEDLKPLCLCGMKLNMGTDIVFDAFAIGQLYEEKDLERKALDFLCEEEDGIFHMLEWERFKQNNPTIAEDLRQKVNERRPKWW